MGRLRASLAAKQARSSGFTLAEVLVAMTIAVIAFVALGFAFVGGLRQSLLAQQNQQAGDLMNKALESARDLGYDNVAMTTADLDTGEAPRSPTLSACKCYNPTNDTTSGATETLVYQSVGGITTHVQAVKQNNGTFTTRTYVTQNVADTAAGIAYKRVTVVVGWTSRGHAHTRSSSTVVVASRSGLPLPDFKFTNNGTVGVCRNPGSLVQFGFVLTNNGARDAWTLSTTTGSPALTWTYYYDVDGDQSYTAGIDSVLPTDPSSGLPSTGAIDPTGAATFYAVASIPDGGSYPPPYTETVTFTARSVAQSGYAQSIATATSVQAGACGIVPTPSVSPSPTTIPSGSPTPTPTPTSSVTPSSSPTPSPTPSSSIPPQPAPSCAADSSGSGKLSGKGTLVDYHLFDQAPPENNTTALSSMAVSATAQPSDTTLYDYSTDLLANTAGRYLDAGSGTSGSAVWRYQLQNGGKLDNGKGAINLFARTASLNSTSLQAFTVTVTLLDSNLNTLRVLASTTLTPKNPWNCAGFREIGAQLTLPSGSGVSYSANQYLQVTVKLAGSSFTPMVLAFGTTSYNSFLEMPLSGSSTGI